MSANFTELQICNKALLRLAANQVESPDGRVATITTESLESKLCILNYPLIRDIVTEDRLWSFALGRVVLDTPELDAPAFGFSTAFAMPNNTLNVWRASRNPDMGVNVSSNNRNSITDPWSYEEDLLLTDLATVYVRFIKRLTDVTILKASPQFVDALSLRLAIEFCMPLTENKAMQDALIAEYQMRLTDASSVDGGQATHEVIRANSLSQARV